VFGRKKEPSFQMTVQQCLAAAVIRHPQACETALAGGGLEVGLPYRKPWVIRMFSRQGRQTFMRRFELDQIGADLWRQIDGRRTAGDLAIYLACKRNLEARQAEDSLIAYLQMLMVRGLVGLVVPQERPESQAGVS
jgi:hypothetical protein